MKKRNRIPACVLCVLLLHTLLFFSSGAQDAYAYPQPEVIQLDLYIQPYRYHRLISSGIKEKHPAFVSVDGGDLQQIDIQIRGESSLESGMGLPSKRLPYELLYGAQYARKSFVENPTVKLINSFTPANLIMQLVAMRAFEYLDIPTPKTVPAFVRINNTDFGLYLVAEAVNETFAEKHFGVCGSIYRLTDPADGFDPDISSERFWLTTKTALGDDTIRGLQQAIQKGEDLERYLDVDEALRFLACETFLFNTDGFMNTDHNTYLCDANGKIVLIPWDEDLVFQVFPETTGADTRIGIRSFNSNRKPLVNLLLSNRVYRQQYRHYIRMLNEKFLDPEFFLPWLEQEIRFLAPYFQRDRTILYLTDDVYTQLTQGNELYGGLDGNLLLTLAEYHDQLQQQLEDPQACFQKNYPVRTWTSDACSALLQKQFAEGYKIESEICENYWRMRRQFYLQEYGSSLGVCGCLFILVFFIAVLAVYKPHRRIKQRRHSGR